tara:strand:+ start:295 stop:1389 length:1095 start_codon:yes stop_codon:yes gene_type:complete
MGKLRKIGKKIGKGIKSVGRKLKKGFGKVAKAFGKLGPLGTVALSFILPGVGSWISGIAEGTSFLQPLAQGLVNAGNFVKNGVGRVFNKVTDAIEYSMNKVSGMGKGTGDFGTRFRDWASEKTGGFIEPSTEGIEPIVTPAQTKVLQSPQGPIKVDVPETVISPEAQVGINRPEKLIDPKQVMKPPAPPKNMVDPVYVQGSGIEGETLRTGYYEAADLNKYYKGVDTPVGLGVEPGVDVAGANISGQVGPPKPIRAVDRANIKTTGDLPIPKGSTSYFNRGKTAFKTITPIATIGADIQAQEDMEAYQAEQARLMKQEYFQEAGMSLLASGSANPNVSFIDFTNPNPSPTELFNLQNSYSGILS